MPFSSDLKRQESVAVPPGFSRAAENESSLLTAAIPKVQALFRFLKLEDAMHLEKCMPKPGKSATSLQHMGASSKLSAQGGGGKRRSEQQSKAAKLAQLDGLKRELELLDAKEVMQRLRHVWEAYCSKKRHLATCKFEMDAMGWLRLLRDARLLDNKFTIMQADSVFSGSSRAAAAAARAAGDASPSGSPGNSFTSSVKEAVVDFDGFLLKLKRMLRIKSPAPPAPAHTGQPMRVSLCGGTVAVAQRKSLSGTNNGLPPALREDPELVALARTNILLFNRGQSGVTAVDAIFSPKLLDLLRQHDAQLRAIYAAYASMEEPDPQRASWEWVRSSGAVVGRTEFMLMLLNFQVLPVLLAKREALDVLSRHRHDVLRPNGAEGSKKDPLTQPAFVEALATVALYIADHASSHIFESMASPDDTRRLQRYVACCDGALQADLQAALAEASAQWSQKLAKRVLLPGIAGTASGSGPSAEGLPEGSGRHGHQTMPWLYSCDGDPVLADVKQRAWQRDQEAAKSNRLAVMARREDVRMKLALTRLHNSYRDVRYNSLGMTEAHLSTWPAGAINGSLSGPAAAPMLHQQASHHAAGSGHRPGELLIPGRGTSPEPGSQLHGSVAFYAGTLQIKTPKTLSAPPGPRPWGGVRAALSPPPPPLVLPGTTPSAQVWSSLPTVFGRAGAGGVAAAASPVGSPSGGAALLSRASDPGWRAEQSQQQQRDPSCAPEAGSVMQEEQAMEAVQYATKVLHAKAVPSTSGGLQSCVAGYGFVPMATPKGALEPIEARDEYENLRAVAERLPALRARVQGL